MAHKIAKDPKNTRRAFNSQVVKLYILTRIRYLEPPHQTMKPSRRIQSTHSPVIGKMLDVLKQAPSDTISLSQGIVFWRPPKLALDSAAALIQEISTSAYCPTSGLPNLREALKTKIRQENNLFISDVMVTAGANQAFTNIVISLCDSDDTVVLFPPYYFNHIMAFQMTGIKNVIFGQRDKINFSPDPVWIEETLSARSANVKMIVITNPCNPTGTVVPKSQLCQISEICAKYNCWLVLDNTYEYFIYDHDRVVHEAIEDPHVLNVFSFSKAYGMMGWRVGYIAYVDEQKRVEEGEDISTWSLGAELLKAQDTIPICPTIISQLVALSALQNAGRSWVEEQLIAVKQNRQAVKDGLISCLGSKNVLGGDGAIYFFAKLPDGYQDDEKVCEFLATKHGVVVIPGSACGWNGYIRVSYANLEPSAFLIGVERLKAGLQNLSDMA
jgi:aromatic aminotransferase